MVGLEVGDGEGHLEDAVIGAGAHVEVVHGDAQLNKENMKCYFKILAKF